MMLRKTLFLALALCALHPALGQSKWIKVTETLVFDNAPFKACHASTLVEIKAGQLLLACFGGMYEGSNDVAIWAGAINKNGKVKPLKVAEGSVNDTLTYPCWNPVLLKKKDGELVLFYKVGPNPRQWWGVYKVSANLGLSWSAAVRLPQGILGPIKNKPIELDNGTILCPSSVELENERWHAFIEQTDGKLTKWKSIAVDTAANFDVIQPSILTYGEKKLQILCRSKQGNVIQSWSLDNGKSWSPLTKTNLLNPNSGTDALTLKSGTQMIVYNPDVPGKDWWNGRANLRVAISTNGNNWQDVMELERGTTQEFSYPAIIQTADGLVHITYTYNRKNIKHVVLKEK